MNIIRDRRSPNHNFRVGATIDAVVIHNTATPAIASPLDWTLRREAQVGYHFLIDVDGSIYETIAPEQRAWHAGKSSLFGRDDVNSFSVGVALVGVTGAPYPEAQIDACAELVADLCARFRVPLNRIVGHDMVAPGRKTDPGPTFDWFAFLPDVGNRLSLMGSPLWRAAQTKGGEA